MRRGATLIAAALWAALLQGAATVAAEPDIVAALVAAYPGIVTGAEGEDLIFADSGRLPLSDGVEGKSFDQRLANADIDDMFALPYRPGQPAAPPGPDDDPGRFRNAAFFERLYGDCADRGFASTLRSVRWVDGQMLQVSGRAGLADRLQAVSDELARLPPEFRKYLTPSAGTFNCRTIAGTDQKSMHAYAAAIDLNVAEADYWRWVRPVAGAYPYRNRIPFEIVAIFERHGFIWGGKWYHFDTMHFEYRPELLIATGVKLPE